MVTLIEKHTLWDWIAIRNLTVEALAHKTGLHRNTLSNWEKGRSRPRYDLLLIVARALDVPVDAITLGRPTFANVAALDISRDDVAV